MQQKAHFGQIKIGGFELASVAGLLALIFCFNAFTLRNGHPWGDDFAMYIHHAENIALHKPYAATGYVYNMRESWYGPRSYPPVFPLLLSPIVALRGLDLNAFKLEEVAALTLGLALVYFLFRRELPLPYTLTLIATLGFNPVLWELKDNVVSDLPFFSLFLLAVLLADRAPRGGLPGLAWGLVTGFVLYLAYGTRNVGLLLLPGLALYEALKFRRLTAFAVSACATAAVLMTAQHFLLRTQEASYADQFHTGLPVFLVNVYSYASVLASFWPPSAGRPLSYLVFALVTLLAGFGAFIRIRRSGLNVFECCLLVYMAVILIWPGNQGMRFLLPLLPLFLGYALIGLAEINSRYGARAGRSALVTFVLATGLLYAGFYRKQNLQSIRETTGLASFNDLCRYVRGNIAPDDVIVFYRARALSLFSDRPASVYFLDGTPDLYNEQWKYMRQIQAKYVIYSPLFEPDRNFLKPVLSMHTKEMEPVYENSDFVVYRLKH